MYNEKEMKELAEINVSEKRDILKMCGDAKKDEETSVTEEIIKKIEIGKREEREEGKEKKDGKEENEGEKIIKELEYEYKYKNATTIPTKTSVTEIKLHRTEPVPNVQCTEQNRSQMCSAQNRTGT